MTGSAEPAAPPLVLIVEDDPLVTDAMRILLEATGHRVANAHTVRQASERLAAERPDVMLLDLTLPDGTGLDVLARAESRPGIVVALTGHDDEATRRRCLDAGCREVLVKPVSVRELLARLRGWLAEGPAAT